MNPDEGDLLTLPAGHPQRGAVSPDLSLRDGVGPPTQEELDEQAARQADVDAVAQAEHDVALAVYEDRLDHEKLRMSSMDPTWVSISGTELVLLHVYGNGFTPTTQIWWHDHLEPTVFVNEHELTTWVTPWAFSNPDEILIGVQDGEAVGEEQFYFSLKP